MNKLIILFFLALVSNILYGQEEKCVCCSYSSLQYRMEYESIFDPALIKEKDIKEVKIYILDSEKYKEMKFQFDKEGQVISRTQYNRRGKPHSIYEFERNEKGLMLKKTFSYLDSLENKATDFLKPKVTDYLYDNNNNLIKTKERSYEGKINIDSKSTYSKIDFDDKGRETKRFSQSYYESEEPTITIYVTSFKYDEKLFEGVSETYSKDSLAFSSIIKYGKNWKPINVHNYNHLVDAVSGDYEITYDSLDRIVSLETQAGPGSFDECPENGTFSDVYNYGKEGLLEQIIHSYGQNECVMTFEYK